jgi:hypothetical protein
MPEQSDRVYLGVLLHDDHGSLLNPDSSKQVGRLSTSCEVSIAQRAHWQPEFVARSNHGIELMDSSPQVQVVGRRSLQKSTVRAKFKL